MRAHVDRQHLPTGIVTFMFTDIEGSTVVLNRVGTEHFARLLAEHYRVIRQAVGEYRGVEVSTEGDSLFAVFVDPLAAVQAAARIQQDLASADWDEDPLRVRIGLHTGTGVVGGDNYIGVDVHKASRISNAAHGGQVVISDVTLQLIEGRLPNGVMTQSLGRYLLSGFAEPVSLHQLGPAASIAQFPPLRARHADSQLPRPLTEFVGRTDEIATGLSFLGQTRLLTLTGPGGTGKTRLSLEIAREAEQEFPDGAYFVALASISDPSLIPITVLDSLNLKTAGGVEPLEHLLRFVKDRTILLILDNFEQLVAGASVVTDLISASTGLTCIVTSRTPLRLSGERELPVPPLGVPDARADVSTANGSEGIQLFLKRAEAVRPDFALTDDNVETIAAIVRSLDGLPLAIELAASRLRSLTPELVLDRLGNQLLKTQSPDLPARQQTIVNAISWSYDLLDHENKLLFEKLSVFSGSFGLDEIELVCGPEPDPLDGVTELVDQSLLRQTETSGQPRFRMLTVIREFAYAALVARGSDRVLLDRHASTYAELAARADGEILTSRQAEWLAHLSEEHDNLRSAFDHAIEVEDVGIALRIAGAMWRFWQIRGHLIEGRQRLETVLEMPAAGLEVARARALIGLGGILYWQGEWTELHPPYQEALDLFREFGSKEEIAEALYNYSFAWEGVGDLDKAESLLKESLELSEQIDRRIGVGRAYWGLGNAAVYREDWATVISAIERSVEEFSAIDAPFDLGWAWFMLAFAHVKMDDASGARSPLQNSLAIFAEVDDLSALALIIEMLALVELKEQDESLAAFFIGAAHRIRMDTGVAITDVEINQYPEMNQFVEGMDELVRASYEQGYNAGVGEVVKLALAELS